MISLVLLIALVLNHLILEERKRSDPESVSLSELRAKSLCPIIHSVGLIAPIQKRESPFKESLSSWPAEVTGLRDGYPQPWLLWRLP